MENSENNEQVENSYVGNLQINDFLLETSKWGKFLAILGYIGMGIQVLLAIFMMFVYSRLGNLPESDFPMGLMGIFYLIIPVIYYFPVTYLYRYSVQIKQGVNSKDLSTVTSGFQNLKSLFKFLGILAIVMISIYALILVIVLPMSFLVIRHGLIRM